MKINIKNKAISTIVAIGLPLVALLSAPASQAYDVKSWNGSNCQSYYGNQEADLGKYAAGIYNKSSTSKWVSCGITRDKMFTPVSSAIGTSAFWVYVVVPTGARTYCYLRENTTNGNSVQTRAYTRIGTGWMPLDTSVSDRYGSRSLYCNLPSRGRLSHIRSYEHTFTDINS